MKACVPHGKTNKTAIRNKAKCLLTSTYIFHHQITELIFHVNIDSYLGQFSSQTVFSIDFILKKSTESMPHFVFTSQKFSGRT